MDSQYQAPAREGDISFINCDDLASKAEKVIPAGGFGYISGGAGDEWTMRENTSSFDTAAEIYPRVLADLESPDLSARLLGIDVKSPLLMAPCAAQGLAHQTAEAGTARGTAAAGTIMAISTYSNLPLDEIAQAGGGAPQFFQFYPSKDGGFNRFMLDRAKAARMKAIVLTADATVGGNRESDKRNNFRMPLPMGNLEGHASSSGLSIKQIFANALQKMSPDLIGKIAADSGLPVIVKGIQCAEDALLSIGAGAAAVWVSNHGGRQLDGAPASFEVLNEIAEAVNRRVPVIFDSGIRRGQHVFKALASGADAVAIGRPALYGLALGGARGVTQVFDFFNRELAMVMQLAGTKNIEEVKRTVLR